jgi:YbbR domain-containing protein
VRESPSAIGWLWENLGSIILAVVLAFSVWVIAVNSQDPVQERILPAAVPIRYQGLADNLTILGDPPETARVTLRAPESTWEALSADDLQLVADLTSLQEGTFELPLQVSLVRRPAQILVVEPDRVRLTLEPSASLTLPVQIVQQGDPAVGYRVESIVAAPTTAVVRGPASLVARVRALQGRVSIGARRENLQEDVELEAVDADGGPVLGLTIAPRSVRLLVFLEQLGGYRTVAVVPITQGQVQTGYRVTNLTVSPTLVTVVSANPEAVDLLPGYVETEPIVLSGASSTLEEQVRLSLPEGFTVVGEESVLVQVSIAPIETSITITRRLEWEGLAPGLTATASPSSVSVILTGPLLTLDQLRPEEVRVVVDLTGLGLGTHQVTPLVVDVPSQVVVGSILPDVLEVTLRIGPPPTPTSLP